MHDSDPIVIVGARENNLRDVDLEIPFGAITAFTGVSGSGKSSLVFDTVAAESQRQLNETFPTFVRNRLPQLGKPDVDRIANLSASVVIDQRPFRGSARSTVGTATDLAPLLRLLFSRRGEPFAGYSTVFSFNQPDGMCEQCQGLGTVDEIDEDALLDRSLSLDEGAIRFPTFAPGTVYWRRYTQTGLFDNDVPIEQWPPEQVDDLLHAPPRPLPDAPPQWPSTSRYLGVVPRFRKLYLTSGSESARENRQRYAADFERVVTTRTCPACGGRRLRPEVLESRIRGLNIADASQLPVDELRTFVADLDTAGIEPVLESLTAGLDHMIDVGLGYLSLDRVTPTLSGGEAQRVKLVRNLGSALTRMTYVLDEPSVGLHPADVHRLAGLLRRLRDKGNTVLVVEHDPDLVAIADHVVDMGPGAGADGGRVVFEGDWAGLRRADTPTGRHLRRRPAVRHVVRRSTGTLARVRGASVHNLRDVDVDVPAGVLCVLTGVAGSGKSSLVQCVLEATPELHLVDQRGVRGGARSMPATYLGVLDPLRRAFASANGVGVEWFSPGSKGGCPVCRGTGLITTELAFMDDVDAPCDACGGRKFNETALSYRLGDLTIADALDVPAVRADELQVPAVADAGTRMTRAGIGYVTLGQSLSTLSGGERQRLKLARELERPAAAYAFDEPTSGLHGTDVERLLGLFDELVDHGSSLVVIEHDLDVMAHADWIIDVGPGAGTDGGRITFEGTPHDLVEHGTGPTADHLRRWLA